MQKNKYPNKIVYNRKSPRNEKDYIDAYIRMFSKASKKDDYDISAVVSKDGEKGHALLKQDANRSKDRLPHRGVAFIPDDELRKKIDK